MDVGVTVLLLLENFVSFFRTFWIIATFILETVALYTIAKRREINKPWLAFIPVMSGWILGSVSDQYRYVTKRQVKNKRKWLLALSILVVALAIVGVVALIYGLLNGLIVIGPPEEDAVGVDDGTWLGVWGVAALILLPLLVEMAVESVLRWMCIYDVLRSCDSQRGEVYFWISFGLSFVGLGGLESVFMLTSMNKDEGMPPRKRATPAPAYIPPIVEPCTCQPKKDDPEC